MVYEHAGKWAAQTRVGHRAAVSAVWSPSFPARTKTTAHSRLFLFQLHLSTYGHGWMPLGRLHRTPRSHFQLALYLYSYVLGTKYAHGMMPQPIFVMLAYLFRTTMEAFETTGTRPTSLGRRLSPFGSVCVS